MRILNQFIKKNKTLSTINKWLKAGFMKEGIKDESLSGSPQGGIISPLLAKYGKSWFKNQHHKLEIDRDINLNLKPRVEYIHYADDFTIGIKANMTKLKRLKIR
ncbi:hypothetical protein [Candidatus Phytoplasma fabacearum]|uniref:hypothetical protein n=1 Tax=Candidatus Phytoplasma fabacearum TaxID=2982628 RepID=UPI002939B393|nr:hypothetical protein [Pigeon pea little leaf phytoplasma]